MNLQLHEIALFLSIILVPLIFAVTFHEAAHGFIAKLRGDSTAAMLGRVTLNPIKHIDPVGTIVVPVSMLLISLSTGTGFLFGWAKPVPVNFNNLKRPRLDMALVALAGPFANFLMAIIWYLLSAYAITSESFAQMAFYGVFINLILMVLNLLPIPPLDGSRIVSACLPNDLMIAYNRLGQYGLIILIVILLLPIGPHNSLLFSIILPTVMFFIHLFDLVFGPSLSYAFQLSMQSYHLIVPYSFA